MSTLLSPGSSKNVHECVKPGHLGTWIGTKWVGRPDPRLGIQQARLRHHHGAHLRRLREEKRHCRHEVHKANPTAENHQCSFLCVCGNRFHCSEHSPCWITIAYAITPVGVVAGKATTDGAWSEGAKNQDRTRNRCPGAPLEWKLARMLFFDSIITVFFGLQVAPEFRSHQAKNVSWRKNNT